MAKTHKLKARDLWDNSKWPIYAFGVEEGREDRMG